MNGAKQYVEKNTNEAIICDKIMAQSITLHISADARFVKTSGMLKELSSFECLSYKTIQKHSHRPFSQL